MRSRASLKNAVKHLDAGFSPERHLYHLLCGAVFDGCMFARLSQANALTVSKPQPDGGDYLPVIYEDSTEVNRFSERLLCSYNRLKGEAGVFASFGDADGTRRDLFRWMRSKIHGSPLDRHCCNADELASVFADAADGGRIRDGFKEIFNFFGYMVCGKICVPVYRKAEMDAAVGKLDETAAEIVLEDMKKALSKISACNELTAVRIGVPEQDIANEIYHLLFGQLNEALVSSGIVAAPDYFPGEGRYLKCFERK